MIVLYSSVQDGSTIQEEQDTGDMKCGALASNTIHQKKMEHSYF